MKLTWSLPLRWTITSRYFCNLSALISYSSKMKEMQESYEKEKADLIQAFENSEDAELEEEADQSEVVPANITVKEITEETEVD